MALFFVFVFVLAVSRDMKDFSSLARDWTRAALQ